MPSPLVIPQTFSTDPAKLKTELEKLTKELDRFLRAQVLAAGQVEMGRTQNPASLAFGQIARVNVPDGSTLVLKLPQPDPLAIGKKCGIRRGSTTGEVLIYAVGCLVAGAERYRMANDLHFVEFLFDGNYYPSRAGGGS